MQTAETLFESELTKDISARIESIKDEISAGHLSDIAEYKKLCGMKEGLLAALDMMAEARERSQQRSR